MNVKESLEKQLNTIHSKEASECIKIYEALRRLNNGSVWSSQWEILTIMMGFSGNYPNCVKIYRPSEIGKVFLRGLE